MEQRAYGTTGLVVSVGGLGAGQVGDGALTEREAADLLGGALDAGITLIDTARGYGESEARIGRHVSHRRGEYVLSTKVGYGVEGHEDWTASCVAAGIDRARRVMRTEVLDIVHLHSCPASVLRSSGVVEALVEAREAGSVRAIAYSGENDDLACALRLGVFDGVMASLNVCDQRVLDEALPAIREGRLGFIAKRPIANAPWRHVERPVGKYVEVYWDRFRTMGFGGESASVTCVSEGVGWAEAALRFAAFVPGVSSVITGTASLEHLRANIDAVGGGALSEEAVAAFREAFSAHDDGWTGQV